MVSRTVPNPGLGRKVSKSSALMLMLMIMASTGSVSMRFVMYSRETGSSSPISTIVMASPCSRAAVMMPSSVERLPNWVML